MLTNGKIPANTACPYASKCSTKAIGKCNHQGVTHPVPFSCATARGFQMVEDEQPMYLWLRTG